MAKAKHDSVALGRQQEPAAIKFTFETPAKHDDVTYAKRSAETKSTVDDWNKYCKHDNVI